ncbi:hypothetical protein [Nonomuraea sp. CA-141351]|uniref:hypothetical protein n=1 Tax=Nonomuraea sp. CA-141351 TaxID=3239996 RepID=UPI003D909BA5
MFGAQLQADTGEWSSYARHEQVTGTPGTRIAGGTGEIQRSTVGRARARPPREPRPT